MEGLFYLMTAKVLIQVEQTCSGNSLAMADFNTLVSQYLATSPVLDAKKTDLIVASDAKKASLGGMPSSSDLFSIGAGIYTGKGIDSAGEMEADLRNLSGPELMQKYGASAADLNAARVQGMNNYRQAAGSQRTNQEFYTDNLTSIGSGLFNGIAGIGALAVGGLDKIGVVPEGSGAYVARKLGDFNAWTQEHQSEGLNLRRQASAARQALDERDHAAQRDAEGGGLIADLKKIGKDTLSSVGNTVSDEMLLADGTASGVGSLFAGGAVGKAIKVGGAAVAARNAVGAVGPSRAAAMIAQATDRVAMPTAIALQEAGGAFQQTASDAVAKGATPQEANDAGLMAAAIQAPAALAIGKVTGYKLEEAPLRVGSVRGALSEIGKETLEEGVQSGSGQLAQNLGLKTFVDPNQDLTQGVGEQVGQGALFGLTTAGAVQAPGVATRAAGQTAKASIKAAQAGVQAIFDRGDRILKEANKASPVSAENFNARAAEVAAEAPVVQEAFKAAVAEKMAPERSPQAIEAIDRFYNNAKFDPAEAAQEAPVIANAVQGATNRFEAIQKVSEIAADPKSSETDKLLAGAYLQKSIDNYARLFTSDIEEAVAPLDDNDPLVEKIQGYANVVNNLVQHEGIVEARQKAIQVMNDLSKVDLSVPQNADAVLTMASTDPTLVDEKTLDTIRAHASSGKFKLTPEQKAILEAASTIVRTTRETLEKKAALGLSYSDQVTSDIQSGNQGTNPGDLSAVQHAKGVFAALRAGDRDLATARLQDFGLFVQHMQNKVDAYNRNYASGKPNVHTSFEGLSKKSRTLTTNVKPVFLNPKAENSIKLAQQAGLDARGIAELFNGMVNAFPDLGVQHVSPVSLTIDPDLNKKSSDILKEHVSVPVKDVKTENGDQNKAPQSGDTTIDKEVSDGSPDQSEVSSEPSPEVQKNDARKEPADLKKEEQVPQKTEVQSETSAAEKTKVESREVDFADAKAEPTQEAPKEVQPEQPYGSLVGSQFSDSFRQPKEKISRLSGTESPISFVQKALQSAATLKAVVGDKVTHKLTDEIAEVYGQYLTLVQPIRSWMDSRLQTFLKKPAWTGAKVSVQDVMLGAEAETNPFDWIRGRALAIVETKQGDELGYNDELVESAILASLQWLVNLNSRNGRVLDEQDVAEILGTDPINAEEHVATFNSATLLTAAKRDLAAMISRFWGVQQNDNQPLGFTKGIPEAVAAELLHAMHEEKMIHITFSDFGVGEETKTFNFVEVSKDKFLQKALSEMAQFPNAIEQVALTDPEEIRYIGKPPEKVAEFQMRNQLVRNTEQQRAAIAAEQKVPHKINPHMSAFLEGMGKDAVVELFGAGDLESKKLNEKHKKTLKGQNTTIGGAYDAFIQMLSEVRNVSEATGKDPSETEIFYDYNVSRVGRLHMLGLHNPQASKLMREVILPTRVTLDMTKSENRDRFMLAVAQAWGIKVHKQPRVKSIEQAYALAHGKFAPALEILSEQLFNDKTITAEDIATIKEAFGGDLSPAAVHAAMEFQRMQTGGEDLSSFTTDLYVEADGVTDGPINALVHISSGQFSENWLKLVAKGGLFFDKDKTVNAHISSDPIDLYEVTTDRLQTIIGDFRKDLRGDQKLTKQMNDLLTLMDRLLGKDLTFDGQDLKIGRGMAKNPLTVTIYGSGVQGIADKVVGSLTKAFYAELSKEAQGQSNSASEIRELMENLTTSSVRKADNDIGLYVLDLANKTEMPKDSSAEAYTLTKDQLNNLRDNVRSLFVNPLRDSVEATIEETARGREKLRKAVQIQSIFAEYQFKKLVTEALSAKPEKDRKNFLSQKELKKILDQVLATNPMISTGTQTFWVPGSETIEGQNTDFARSLSNHLGTPAYVYGPKDAGVAGIPYMVIGPGDGQMMQNLSTMDGAPSNTLKVFDGVHLGLSSLENDARKVNQAVHEAWLQNPLASVNESFQSFLAQASFEGLSDDHLTALKEALFPRQESPSPAEIAAEVQAVGKQLAQVALEAQARHNVLAKVSMSVDHMASAEAPFQSEGLDLSGLKPDEVVERLNALYEQELKNLQKPVEAKESKAEVQEQSQTVPEVRVVKAADFRKLLDKKAYIPEQLNLLKEVVRSDLDGWEIVQGTKAQVQQYARDNGAVPFDKPGLNGYMSLNEKRIYVTNRNSEVILHELIHASVTQKISAYYADPKSVSPEVAEAIQNTERLMAQWEAQQEDLSGLTPDQREAYFDALREMNARRNDASLTKAERQAAALDEFLTWNLSNQDLIRVAQKTRVLDVLARIAKRVLIAMKPVFWGRKMAPMVKFDMYSALRFNASLIINSATPLQTKARETIRAMATKGSNPKLVELYQGFTNKIASLLDEQPNEAERQALELKIQGLQITMGDKVADAVMRHGFSMDTEEHSLFALMVTTFATQAKLNQASLARAQELYDHVIKSLTKNVSLLKTDPDSLDPAQEFMAQERMRTLTGVYGKEYDDQGRSTLLPTFLALAAVSSEFQAILAKIELPKTEVQPNNSLDNILTNVANVAMDELSRTLSGEGRGRANVQEAVEALTRQLTSTVSAQSEAASQLINPIGNVINSANDLLSTGLKKGSQYLIDKADELKAQTNNKTAEALLEMGKLVASIVNEEAAPAVAESAISAINQINLFRPLAELVTDFIGRTDSNAVVFDMIKKVGAFVQQTRQQFREHVPEIIAKRFKQELSKERWTDLYNGLAKTDLSALTESMSVEQIVDMLADESKIYGQIKSLKDRITKTVGESNAALIIKKGEELAKYMVFGQVSPNLLRNAEAIANLFGVQGSTKFVPTVDLIKDVDQLVSLLALSKQGKTALFSLADLARNERDGMIFSLSYLKGQRKAELSKISTDRARLNHYKGHIPSVPQGGAQLIVANDSESKRLLLLGYQRVGDYLGSSAEFGARSKGYYFSPVSGKAQFNQGIMQNVRQTVSGVDPVTGYTHGLTGGIIAEAKQVQQLTKSRRHEAMNGEHLMPIYDADGQVLAYERAVDPSQLARLNASTHMAKMIGVWRGRQVEEMLASKFNESLIDGLKKIWDDASGRKDGFVNLLDPAYLKTDRVSADAVSLFTPETLAYIQDVFGGDGFMVRKDMLNDAIGYRSPSVGDAWTGNTRFDPRTAEVAKRLAVGVFGVNAYKYLVTAEKLLQNLVVDARQLIVVKSVVVPVSNLIANVYQMMSRGVGLQRIATAMPKKLAEVSAYTQRRVREIEIQAELLAAESDVMVTRRLNAELTAITDANKRMSIWPLIEAGEFSSISEAGVLEKEETSLYEGKLSEFIERQVDKLPKPLRTAGKYALVSQDTALFAGMRKAMEYGDFLGKAVLYEHLTESKKLSSQEALAKITEEFVNYDRLAGRTRSYLESIGLLWFWNFKVRIAKIAMATLRENPLHALLTNLVPTPTFVGSIGTPLSDNFFAVLADGDLGYSVGPEMGLNSHQLNPWFNLFN